MIGLEVGHETIADDGLVSWLHAHFTKRYFLGAGFDKNMSLILQTRHPLMTISSLRRISLPICYPETEIRIWKMIDDRAKAMRIPWEPLEQVKENHLLACMNLWYWWNKVGSEKADQWYAIEHLSLFWPRLLTMLQVPETPMPELRKTINRHSKGKVLSWNDLYRTDPDLTHEILRLAAKFGYRQIPASYIDDPFYRFPKRIRITL
jgi:hypothetical protein